MRGTRSDGHGRVGSTLALGEVMLEVEGGSCDVSGGIEGGS